MVLFLGYIEERWGYLVNQERKKKRKEINEIQDKSSHEIIQEPIVLLHDSFWQFCLLPTTCMHLGEWCAVVL